MFFFVIGAIQIRDDDDDDDDDDETSLVSLRRYPIPRYQRPLSYLGRKMEVRQKPFPCTINKQ